MAVPTNDPSSSSSAQTAQEIKTLLQQLRKSSRQRKKQKRSGGGSGSGSANDRDDALRLDKLRKIFGGLIDRDEFDLSTAGKSNNSGDSSSASSQWKTWLITQHETFITYLLEGIVDGKSTALRTYCGVLASSPVAITGLSDKSGKEGNDCGLEEKKKNGMISERLLNKLLEGVVKSRLAFDTAAENDNNENINSSGSIESILMAEEPMLTLFETEFLRPHRDVQYFVYKGVHQIALDLLAGLERLQKNGKSKDEAERNVGLVAENLCRLLMMMEYVPKRGHELEESGYLFTPPVLGEGIEGESEDEADSDVDEEESDEDASDSSDDDEEESTSNKRKKSSTNSKNNKRSKKTKKKLIAWQQPYKHRNAHQEAWLSVLRLPDLPVRTQKRVLQHLSTYVLNVCPSPLRFAEYFTRSFQGGTSVSAKDGSVSSNTSNSLTAILSLHGLFILMLDHQLEYPQFYNSLYQLLHPRILYTKHRTRFLRLLSKALLSNSMLPAYVVASFCKRLCRLALSGPPSGGLFVLALVSNLLRKHGECACLIHRRGNKDGGGEMDDVFVEDANDLIKTRALESSLWELTAFERHYHPAISTLAKSVGTEDDKTTPMYDMEDFMAHTYKSLFEQEKKRLGSGSVSGNTGNAGKKKKGGGGGRVSLTFVEPEGLFRKDDVFGGFFKSS